LRHAPGGPSRDRCTNYKYEKQQEKEAEITAIVNNEIERHKKPLVKKVDNLIKTRSFKPETSTAVKRCPEDIYGKLMKNWQVYILHCGDETLYTGITNNLEQRLKAHNEKRGARYTRTRLPVTLVYQEEAASRSQASRREIIIKKLPRRKKLELIATSADS
jgi:putative endonuclease